MHDVPVLQPVAPEVSGGQIVVELRLLRLPGDREMTAAGPWIRWTTSGTGGLSWEGLSLGSGGHFGCYCPSRRTLFASGIALRSEPFSRESPPTASSRECNTLRGARVCAEPVGSRTRESAMKAEAGPARPPPD